MERFKSFSPVILRLGLAAVMLWFGCTELLHPAQWTSFMPAWASGLTGMSPIALVTINGIAEVVLGLMLAFGIWVRVVSGLLFLHMLLIVIDVGLSAIGVRDAGLAAALLAIFVQGSDSASLL